MWIEGDKKEKGPRENKRQTQCQATKYAFEVEADNTPVKDYYKTTENWREDTPPAKGISTLINIRCSISSFLFP